MGNGGISGFSHFCQKREDEVGRAARKIDKAEKEKDVRFLKYAVLLL